VGTTGWIVIGVIVLIVLFGIVLYNGLVAGRNQVEAAWRQIDVQLKRRRDLIPNLVETVKGYMGYEQETLQAVIKARNAAVSAEGGPREGQIQAEAALGASLGRLFALSESYPDLKANQNAMQLQDRLLAPALQRLRHGAEHPHRKLSRRADRRLDGLHQASVFRGDRAGPRGAAGEAALSVRR
jgi:hypothetical protein